MYTSGTGLILGFHGGDKTIYEKIIRGKLPDLKQSNNPWDWLGQGIYFWQNNPQRAFEFAEEQADKSKSSIKVPFVVGAVIDLGYCLDLMDSSNLKLVAESYKSLKELMEKAEQPLPINLSPKDYEYKNDLLIRRLDCAVIQALHEEQDKIKKFDSVKGIFTEGKPLYENAGFREKDHVQICIRNPNFIKGYFLPRKNKKGYLAV